MKTYIGLLTALFLLPNMSFGSSSKDSTKITSSYQVTWTHYTLKKDANNHSNKSYQLKEDKINATESRIRRNLDHFRPIRKSPNPDTLKSQNPQEKQNLDF